MQMVQQHLRAVAGGRGAAPFTVELTSLERALELDCRQAHGEILKARPGIERMLRDLDLAAARLLVPREIGHMVRMPAVGRLRRVAGR
jgi:hypothetical protein